MKKIVSVFLTVCMLVSLTACGKDSQQDVSSTVENTTESVKEKSEFQSSEQTVDDGSGNDVADTTTTESETIESDDTEASSGDHTYNVDGVEIKLRTNIEDYIVERTGAIGTYKAVNMLAIAESLGYEHTGTMGDGSEVDPGKITQFNLAGNSKISVKLSDKKDQGYHTVYFAVEDNGTTVNFNRNDISDDSVTTYWIYNGEGSSVVCTVNYEEIVIFTYLLENGAFAPSEDWMETSGIATSTGPSVFNVNK